MSARRTAALLALIACGLLQCHRRATLEPTSDPAPVAEKTFAGDPSPGAGTASPEELRAKRAAELADQGADEDEVLRALRPPPEPGEWIASKPDAPGLHLGGFAVLAPSTAEHPQGLIAAFGSTKTELFVVRVDVATGHELARQRLDSVDYDDLAFAGGSLVLATQTDVGLALAWFDEGAAAPRRRRVLAGIGTGLHDRLRAVVGLDDRLVFVSGGYPTTTMRLFDASGAFLSAYACNAGLRDDSPAILERMGDQVMLTNPNEGVDSQPVCAVHLHGAPRWHEVRLRGEPYARGDKIYLYVAEHGWRELGEDLQPRGPEVLLDERLTRPWPCWGLTGTIPWQHAVIGTFPVVRTVACCGDSGGGLFICQPPMDSDAGADVTPPGPPSTGHP
jgi:hypothetical protein